MARVLNYVPRIAIFLAGVAAAAMTLPRRERGGMGSVEADELKRSLADLEARLHARAAADGIRLGQVEIRLEEHSAKLREVPSTGQIVAAMEQLLTKTMASLDDRLSSQANSIEVLKTAVSQTDGLLERVLESLDSLQTMAEPVDFAEDPIISRSRI